MLILERSAVFLVRSVLRKHRIPRFIDSIKCQEMIGTESLLSTLNGSDCLIIHISDNGEKVHEFLSLAIDYTTKALSYRTGYT